MTRISHPRLAAFGLVAASAALLAVLAGQRNAPGSLLPHGYCFTWNPALLWTHVIGDSMIGLAYVSIPLTLLHLVRKRGDMPFNWILLLFATFIVSCGATHLIEVWTVWNPDYWLAGNVKVVTAVASVLTAVALVRLVPRLLAIPTVAQLTAVAQALEEEVNHRRAVEEELRRERAELEHRVQARTRELAEATAAAEAAHAQAEEANRLKDQFLAKVSHELRTPLQSTLSWVQVLQDSRLDPAQTALACERLIHNVRSQARLIDDLLDISRILSGKLQLHMQEADPAAVIDKAVEVVRVAALPQGIGIELDNNAGGTRINTDPARLEQVVWNLISNAVQSSPRGGRVRVEVKVEGSGLRVDVQDWGRGIDPAELPHLFEPFHQGQRNGNAHRGLGLGLAITRSIVALFGGEMQVRSEGLGRGACFTVRLPLHRVDRPAQAGTGGGLSADESARVQGLHVLYVEDHPDIAEAGRIMLASLGAEPEVCLDFEQAQRRVAEGGFDVFLTDLNLGGGAGGGMELLHALRRTPHGRDMRAVVLSAYGSREDRQASLAAGFTEHLVKPVDAVDVARALIGS